MFCFSRRGLFFALTVLCFLPNLTQAEGLNAVPGQVLICLEQGVDGNLVLDGAARGELASVQAEFGLDQGRFIAPVGQRQGPEAGRFLILYSRRHGFDPVAAARALAGTPEIHSAAPNYRRPVLVMPNDPMLSTQWHLQAGASGVSMPVAWDVETGSPATVIAIIDTGVDIGHPDLAANIWTNENEIAGNGLDDDGNGFVDDVHGWDFGNNDNDPRPQVTPDASGVDVGFHGTHCAGIAAAVTDNNVGVAGAGWGCAIMPLKLPNNSGEMTDVAITGAVLYAIAQGADVLSMSFGGPDQDGMAAFMQDLMDQALAANIVCVAAAGNSNTSEMFYPAACAGVISVGATDENNQRASFSTYGAWVDIAAPGNRIWSTISQNYEFGFLDGLLYMLSMGWDGANPYMYSDGTSMACPLVAGVCGLIRNQMPGLSPAAVLDRLVSTGDEVAFDQPIGVKLNAGQALSATSAAPVRGLPGDLQLAAVPNPFNPQTRLDFTLPTPGRVTVRVFDSAGRLVRTLLAGVRPAGPASLIFDGRDGHGQALSSGMYFVKIEAGSLRAERKLLMVK